MANQVMWVIVTSAFYHPYMHMHMHNMCMCMHMHIYGKNIYFLAD